VWSLIIPFHSDFQRLHPTLDLLDKNREQYSIREVLLCHNGPRLEPDVESRLVRRAIDKGATYLHTDVKGIGAGYALGIRNASQHYCLLSASDLPFGFTDLDSFYRHQRILGETPQLAIGSKGRIDSAVEGNCLNRRAASWAFWILRVALLGRQTPRDSQGTILIASALAKELVHHCICDDYFFSVELITLAQQRGVKVVELPVQLGRENGMSSVSVVRDGWKLVRQLVRFSRRLKTGNPYGIGPG
jgi:hypothetical protein